MRIADDVKDIHRRLERLRGNPDKSQPPEFGAEADDYSKCYSTDINPLQRRAPAKQ